MGNPEKPKADNLPQLDITDETSHQEGVGIHVKESGFWIRFTEDKSTGEKTVEEKQE